MKSCELATYVTAVACFIFENCSEEELPIMCAMLSQLNDTLRTMIAQNIFCKKETERVLKEQKEAEKFLENKRNLFYPKDDDCDICLKSILEGVKKEAEK